MDLDLSNSPVQPPSPTRRGVGGEVNPPDSFEVALLDPLTLTPLVNTDIGLTETDALLNIQNDGTTYFSNIETNSVQIATQPNNGFVTPNPDGTVSYLPDIGFAGTDSFTHVVQDNDGEFSNPATVTVTVDNVAPTIDNIQLPDNITEGIETTITAIVNGLLIAHWRSIIRLTRQFDFTSLVTFICFS